MIVEVHMYKQPVLNTRSEFLAWNDSKIFKMFWNLCLSCPKTLASSASSGVDCCWSCNHQTIVKIKFCNNNTGTETQLKSQNNGKQCMLRISKASKNETYMPCQFILQLMANEIFQVKIESLQYVLDSSTSSHRFYGEVHCLLLGSICYHLIKIRMFMTKQSDSMESQLTQTNIKLVHDPRPHFCWKKNQIKNKIK